MSDPLTIEYRGQPVDLQALMRHILEHEAADRYSPWFFTYYADLAGEAYLSKYVRFARKLLALQGRDLAGQEMLDAGCGFGIMATLMALMGARVHGLDCHRGMIDTFRTYLSILPYELPVFPREGDVAAMPYDDGTFDLVLSHEAVSHYGDVDGFVREAHRVLRPGGALILSDSNNARNRRVVRQTWAIWSAFENGPAGIEVHGHRIEEPFVEVRSRIIARELPHLDSETVALLARHTSGLWGDELLQTVAEYRENGDLPDGIYQEGTCPIDPVQGYYIERLFDPYALEQTLQGVGFRTHLYAYLGGARGGTLALANDLLTWRPLTPLVLNVARSFRILARKEGVR